MVAMYSGNLSQVVVARFLAFLKYFQRGKLGLDVLGELLNRPQYCRICLSSPSSTSIPFR